MKRKDLINRLQNAGFSFERHGAGHDVYRRGSDVEYVPRHREINEKLAHAIIRKWDLGGKV